MGVISGGPAPNLLQSSLEANRVQQVHKTEFHNLQGHMFLQQHEEDRKKMFQVPSSKKTLDKKVARENPRKRQSPKQKGEPDKKGRGQLLDVRG